MEQLSVRQIMTKNVVCVSPETPLLDVYKLLSERGFNGVPVVDNDKKLIGIITQYNLISQQLHLPTLQTVISNLPVFHKDKKEFDEELGKISKLTAKDVMDATPLTLDENASFEDAIKLFQEHHRVNPVPVIDKDRRVIGVISRYDFLKPLKILGDLHGE